MRRRQLVAAGVGVMALVTTTTGCGFHGLYSASLPGSVGGPFSGDKTYPVTVYFDDVLDLVPQSAVKVNDVTVGTVTAINLVSDQGSYAAQVRIKVKDSVDLPANTTAILEETSLLGEKYVELVNPQTPAESSDGLPAHGSLREAKVIGPDPSVTYSPAELEKIKLSTQAYPGVEEVFGVLSMVLNQGAVGKLQTINSELSAALAGREQQVHDVFTQLNSFVGGLNTVKTQINGAIDALDTLSTNLNQQDAVIATALDDIGPGVKVLADERAQLVSLLQSLSQLGVVSNRVINASLSATQADLASLEPILTQLNKAGANLPGALELAFDYPFPSTATQAIKGDQTNLIINVSVSGVLQGLCATPANASITQACQTLTTALGTVTGLLGATGASKAPAVRPGGETLGDLLGQAAAK